MPTRSIVVIGGVFGAAALAAAFVVSQLPRADQRAALAPLAAPPAEPGTTPPDDPATAEDGRIEIRAGAGGTAIEGARVTLYRALSPAPGVTPIAWRRAGEGQTDRDGIARIPARSGPYLAAVRADGLAAAHALVSHPGAGETSRTLVDLAPGVPLQGRVQILPDRQPGEIRVTLVPLPADAPAGGLPSIPPEETVAVTADATGAFSVEGLAPGLYGLAANAPGHHAMTLPRVAVPRAGPLELALEPLGLVSGEVLAAHGAAAAGATVEVASRDHAARATADADGRFALRVPGGTYQITAQLDGSAAARSASVAVGGITRGLELRLGPGAVIEGEVVHASSGGPAPGAELAVLRHGTGTMLTRATAGEDGRFRVSGLPPGAYDVRAAAPGVTPARAEGLTLEAGARFPVRLGLERTGAIEGTVHDATGQPLAGARVRVLSRGDGLEGTLPLEARSDFDGRFRLEGIEAGRAELVAVQDALPLGDARAVRVAPGGTSRVEHFLPQPGLLAGRVSAEGRPPPLGTAVIAVPQRAGPGTLQVARALADASGNYGLVLPAGEYRVHAAPAESARTDLRVAPAFARVPPGGTAELPLALAAAPAEEGLEILVLEPGGAPSAGAVVTIARPDDGKVALAAAAGEDGRARLGKDLGLAGLTAAVRARNGGRSGEVRVALPASGTVEVTLAPGGALEGRVRTVGRPAEGLTVEVAAQPAQDGWRTVDVHRFTGERFALGDLPAESLRVSVRTDDGRRGEALVRLASGETRAIEIDLEAAARR